MWLCIPEALVMCAKGLSLRRISPRFQIQDFMQRMDGCLNPGKVKYQTRIFHSQLHFRELCHIDIVLARALIVD